MKALTQRDAIKTITTHYIDGAFVESHGREVRKRNKNSAFML